MQKKIKSPVLFIIFLVLSCAWIAFIFLRSAQPAVSSSEESGRLLSWLQQFFPWLTVFLIRKAAHFTEFFILGALTSCTFRAAGIPHTLPALLTGLVVAVSDELIQLTQEGRSCEVRDMCIDFAGAAFAALVFFLIFYLYDRRKKSAAE